LSWAISPHTMANSFLDRSGQTVPYVSFRFRENGEWRVTDSEQLFRGKSVIVFSLPGAFTPTCSSTHLPRFNELAPMFRRRGIDSIVCISVNDPYVMEEWARAQGADRVTLLPDGNGAFTEALGLMADKSDIGLGRRSWRYSMLVRDQVIERMFIEPRREGDPFEVSDADTMLSYLDPTAGRPRQAAVLSKRGCPFCAAAKRLLSEAGYEYVDIDLSDAIRARALAAFAGATTVPQVYVDGVLIGGSLELSEFLEREGRQAT
jgi:glutaredoxin-like protein